MAYFYLDDAKPAAVAAPKVATAKKKVDESVPEFMPEDFTMRFDHAKPIARNIFLPPAPPSTAKPGLTAPLDRVPADLAGGDGNWTFNGIAVLDGKTMALLENSTSHQGDYVSEGSLWRTSRIRRISADGIALEPKAGGAEMVVFRYQPASPKSEASPAGAPPGIPALPPVQPAPINPQALTGPIGDGIVIRRARRGRSIQFGTP